MRKFIWLYCFHCTSCITVYGFVWNVLDTNILGQANQNQDMTTTRKISGHRIFAFLQTATTLVPVQLRCGNLSQALYSHSTFNNSSAVNLGIEQAKVGEKEVERHHLVCWFLLWGVLLLLKADVWTPKSNDVPKSQLSGVLWGATVSYSLNKYVLALSLSGQLTFQGLERIENE